MSSIPPISPIVVGVLDLSKAAVTTGKLATAPEPKQPTQLDRMGWAGAYTSIALSAVGGGTAVASHLMPSFAKTYAHPISFIQTIKSPLGFMPGAIAFTVGLKKDDPVLTAFGAAGMATSSGGFRWIETVAKESPSQLIRVAPGYFKAAIAVAAVGVGLAQLTQAISAPKSPHIPGPDQL